MFPTEGEKMSVKIINGEKSQDCGLERMEFPEQAQGSCIGNVP